MDNNIEPQKISEGAQDDKFLSRDFSSKRVIFAVLAIIGTIFAIPAIAVLAAVVIVFTVPTVVSIITNPVEAFEELLMHPEGLLTLLLLGVD